MKRVKRVKRVKSDAVADGSKKQRRHSGVGPPVVSNDHKPAHKRQVSFISGDTYYIPLPPNDGDDTVGAFATAVEKMLGVSGIMHLVYAPGTREDDERAVVLNVGSKYNYPVAMNLQSDNTTVVTDPNESMAPFDTTSAGADTVGWVLDASTQGVPRWMVYGEPVMYNPQPEDGVTSLRTFRGIFQRWVDPTKTGPNDPLVVKFDDDVTPLFEDLYYGNYVNADGEELIDYSKSEESKVFMRHVTPPPPNAAAPR